MLKFIVPGVLVFALVVLSWMSFLRVDNMAHDVSELQKDVDALKQQMAERARATPGRGEAAPIPAGPQASTPPSGGSAAPGAVNPPSNAHAQIYEATLEGFFSSTAPGPQMVTLPFGTSVSSALVVITAVEGEDVAPVVLPSPQPSVTLQPGQPQSVTGLCQGPPTAAWVFTLQGNAIRVESRECHYPVRGLKPHLRITVRP